MRYFGGGLNRIRPIVLGVTIGLARGEDAMAQAAAGRILIETTASGVASVAGAFVFGAIGLGLNQKPGDDETVAAFWGGMLGTSIGAGAGATIGGRLAGVPTDLAGPMTGGTARQCRIPSDDSCHGTGS